MIPLLAIAGAVSGLVALRAMRSTALWWAAYAGHASARDLADLFVFVSTGRILIMTTALAASCLASGWALHLPPALLALLVVFCLTLPRIALRVLRARRAGRLMSQLPDALALWSGLLQAGQGVAQALAQVAARQSAPLSDELRLVLGEMRLGTPIDLAFNGFCARSGAADLRMLSTLLATHRELGGNLAESLQRLAGLLRTRLMMEARIHSITAQGRMQGVIVGALPLLLMAALYIMEPRTMRVLHTTWQGWAALGVIAMLELCGFLLIRRIVKVVI
jgi:tight adherence protein B